MKCLKDNCTGKYKESPHNKNIDYRSFRCLVCRDLRDESEIIKKDSIGSKIVSEWAKRDDETEEEYRKRMIWAMPYF